MDIIKDMQHCYTNRPTHMASIDYVREFHERFNHPIKNTPDISDKKLNRARVEFLAEELNELSDAFDANDKVEVLDALLDLQYFLDGTFIALGMAHLKDPGFLDVHISNMSKLWPDGKPRYNEIGKVRKGPNYSPPNLKQFFEEEEE